MYSDMSTWMRACSSPNRNSASVRASSVLPTPDGPRKMNEPAGRFGSLMPARARRMARLVAVMAASWPMTRLCSSSSMRSSFCVSASVSLNTGMPVHIETMSAISSSPMDGRGASSAFHSSSRSRFLFVRRRSVSRRFAAFSNSCASMAASLSLRTPSISSSSSRYDGGAVMVRMRMRLPASSMRSMALSGRNRSEM